MVVLIRCYELRGGVLLIVFCVLIEFVEGISYCVYDVCSDVGFVFIGIGIEWL